MSAMICNAVKYGASMTIMLALENYILGVFSLAIAGPLVGASVLIPGVVGYYEDIVRQEPCLSCDTEDASSRKILIGFVVYKLLELLALGLMIYFFLEATLSNIKHASAFSEFNCATPPANKQLACSTDSYIRCSLRSANATDFSFSSNASVNEACQPLLKIVEIVTSVTSAALITTVGLFGCYHHRQARHARLIHQVDPAPLLLSSQEMISVAEQQPSSADPSQLDVKSAPAAGKKK